MAHNVQGTFVSEKINKIRWRPDPFNDCRSFVTGSWDNEANTLKLWELQQNEDISELCPYTIGEYVTGHDVTEIKFVNSDEFVASTTNGEVGLYYIKITPKGEHLIEKKLAWNNLHKFNNGDAASCTAVATYDRDIASVGEDGNINMLSTKSDKVLRCIDNADSCTIRCVVFLKHNELLTSNTRGQMKIWDLRSGGNSPSNSFVLSGDMVSPTCVEFHPTQRHLVVAGDEEGSLTVWDLRQNTFPVNLLSAYQESVTEIKFHPDNPDHLFTSSSSGELWHWSVKNKPSFGLPEEADSNFWLATENLKNKLEVFTLMDKLYKPINSFDLNQSKVICGCDNEAIYTINDVNMYK